MRQVTGLAAVPTALALALLTACAADTHHCTLTDSPGGMGVEVHPELANKVVDATLTAC